MAAVASGTASDVQSNIGGFTGIAMASVDISGCTITGEIRGNFNIGGFIGRSMASVAILDSIVNAHVHGSTFSGGFVGLC